MTNFKMNIVQTKTVFFSAVLYLLLTSTAFAQQQQLKGDSLLVSNNYVTIVADLQSGKVHYRFNSGTQWENTIAYIDDIHLGLFSSDGFLRHIFTSDDIEDSLGKGVCINLVHEDSEKPLRLVQHITIYSSQPFILISAEAQSKKTGI